MSSRIGDASLNGTLPIRQGCVDSFAATVGPVLIRAVSGSARWIALWSDLTPGLTEQLHDREIDMAACMQTVLSDARIAEIPLFSEASVVLAAHSYLDGREESDWRALVQELPLIRLRRAR